MSRLSRTGSLAGAAVALLVLLPWPPLAFGQMYPPPYGPYGPYSPYPPSYGRPPGQGSPMTPVQPGQPAPDYTTPATPAPAAPSVDPVTGQVRPAPPGQLLLAGYTGDRAGLRWDRSPDADVESYKVYAAAYLGSFFSIRLPTIPYYYQGTVTPPAPAEPTYQLVGVVRPSANLYIVLTRLMPGNDYEFYVTAVNRAGVESLPSNPAYISAVDHGFAFGQDPYGESPGSACNFGYGVPCWPD